MATSGSGRVWLGLVPHGPNVSESMSGLRFKLMGVLACLFFSSCRPHQVFRVVTICLGSPPETFTWEFYDKEKNYHKIGPVSPLRFYKEHVKPVFNMEDKVGWR